MKPLINFLFLLIISSQSLMADQQVAVQDRFTQGYIHCKLEEAFPNQKIAFDIQENTIIVYDFPSDVELCKNIQLYLETFPDYSVVFARSSQPISSDTPQIELNMATVAEEGSWLPELSPFFPTMLAQPHIIGYSAGYRSYDKTFKTDCLPVSIGDQFSLYQFKTKSYGQLYIGIEACVWAIFEARAKSLSLINADYYVGIPLTYIHDKFSARLRVFHESSHLGDEFLLEHGRILRLNPSMEVVDLSIAYELTDRMTVFAGFSRVIRSDDSYRIKPNTIYYGFNYTLNSLKIKLCNLEATPYVATYFTNLKDNKWKIDSSIAVGYQWDKLYGHKFRVYIEGHEGYSHEGQFSKQKTRYIALKMLYGY